MRVLIVDDKPAAREVDGFDVARHLPEPRLVFAYGPDGRALTDYSLAELETRLARFFVRVSRADLVHVAHIEKVVSNGDGSLTLHLREGTRSASVAAAQPKYVSCSAADPHCPIAPLPHCLIS